MTGLVYTSTRDAAPFLETFAQGRLEGLSEGDIAQHNNVFLAITGVGKVKATLYTERLLQQVPLDRVVHVGMCTGLNDAFELGTLVAADSVLEGDRIALSAPSYPQMPLPTPDGLPSGTIVTHDHSVQEDEEGYWQRLADLSDTTAYAVAYVAAQHGVPCHVVKAVTSRIGAEQDDFQQTLAGARAALTDFTLKLIEDEAE